MNGCGWSMATGMKKKKVTLRKSWNKTPRSDGGAKGKSKPGEALLSVHEGAETAQGCGGELQLMCLNTSLLPKNNITGTPLSHLSYSVSLQPSTHIYPSLLSHPIFSSSWPMALLLANNAHCCQHVVPSQEGAECGKNLA